MTVAGSSVSPPAVSPAAHAAAVNDLIGKYRALPPGARVRLGKKSSNLFRFGAGAAADVTRLDTTALTGVLGVDPKSRTAEVQGMTTYE
ncbi:MAG TPA: FAD-binding protein, partial [Pseudonocardia sp.]